jgi:ribosome-associated heat shock protein Hsp15
MTRIDKWLWAARFYKTRSLAQEAIEKGRVKVDREHVKPARALKPGDRLQLSQGDSLRDIEVLGLSERRGPAPEAQRLYRETEASIATNALTRERRKLFTEPALTIEQGRPTKQHRRALDRLHDLSD